MESKRVEHPNRIEWRNEKDTLHRLDGPAIEWNNGTKQWLVNGVFHREDGPAVEYFDGTRQWFINGKRHREDGPAIEYSDGDKRYYLNNIKYTEEKFHQELIKLKLSRIKDL